LKRGGKQSIVEEQSDKKVRIMNHHLLKDTIKWKYESGRGAKEDKRKRVLKATTTNLKYGGHG
jgi:hypothetical protein